MTNPCVYVKGPNGKTIMELVKGKLRRKVNERATQELRNRAILSNEEIDTMLQQADNLKTEYFWLRAKALICLVKKFGKRRSEIARLELSDLNFKEKPLFANVEKEDWGDWGDNKPYKEPTIKELEITFHLSKKHKRGLHQFLEFCEKDKHGDPSILEKPLPEIKKLWKEWQKTEEGHTLKNSVSLQSINLEDKYAKPITEYYTWLKKNNIVGGYFQYKDEHAGHICSVLPSPIRYLFPSGKSVFGESYVIDCEKHLSGSQLLRIIKQLNPSAWLHLFRETKGAEIARSFGRNLNAIYEVRDGLDLENEETAYHYVRRYVAKKQEVEK